MKSFIVAGEIDRDVADAFFDYAIENRYQSEVVISSPGGDIGLMVGMYDVIQKHGWDTLGLGVLQSAAAVLFQAGKKRYLSPNSLLLFHEPKRQDNGDFSDQDWYLFTKLVQLVQIRTGAGTIETHDLFDNKFITAQRAIALGLADEIWGEPPAPPEPIERAYPEGGANGTSN